MATAEGNGKTRTRLAPEARRRQLVQIAAESFAEHPYADVYIEQIAERAGVSVGLIYHHFADKQDLFAAVVDNAIEELGKATELDPTLPPLERVRGGIDGYINYIERHEYAYRAMHRGMQSGDARVRDAIERNTQRQIDRGCETLLGTKDGPPKLQLAIRGWLAYVIATCLDWLDRHQITHDELRTLHLHALNGALAGAFAHDEPADPTQDGSLPVAPATASKAALRARDQAQQVTPSQSRTATEAGGFPIGDTPAISGLPPGGAECGRCANGIAVTSSAVASAATPSRADATERVH